MKKSALLAVCLLFCAYLHAQTYVSGHLTVSTTDSMRHDSVSCNSVFSVTYNITIDSSYTGETVNIIDTYSSTLLGSYINTSGVSPWIFATPYGTIRNSGSWDKWMSGSYAHFFAAAVKITAGMDTIKSITCFDSLLITDPCSYNNVTGFAYIDNNANCTYDVGDVGIHAPTINFSENLSSPPGVGWPYGWLQVSTAPAWYSIIVQESWMVNYTVSLPAYYAFIFPTSLCFGGPYTFTTLPQTGVDFPLQCTSNVDLQCGALAPPSVRLHKAFYMQPYVSNTGCDSISGQLTLVKDSRVIYDPTLSTHPADIVHGDTLIWNYSNLTNLSSGAYWNSFSSDINLTPNTTVAVGDTLCFRVFTNMPSSDINIFNNDYSICLPVVYSYDPNIKEVMPKGVGPQGNISASNDTLTYTLHFQNTGTAAAYDITVTDTLNSHVNANSLKILGSSHNMLPKWVAPGVVQFVFNNINLPDSTTNEPASHGSVQFSVALKPGLPMGTQIKNTGYIYFDANPAVVTNTVVNTIAIPNKIDQTAANAQVKIYPNPATDLITVENLNGGNIAILNLNGQLMIEQNISNNQTTIDVSQLPGGVYIMKTISNSGTNTTKFTKY